MSGAHQALAAGAVRRFGLRRGASASVSGDHWRALAAARRRRRWDGVVVVVVGLMARIMMIMVVVVGLVTTVEVLGMVLDVAVVLAVVLGVALVVVGVVVVVVMVMDALGTLGTGGRRACQMREGKRFVFRGGSHTADNLRRRDLLVLCCCRGNRKRGKGSGCLLALYRRSDPCLPGLRNVWHEFSLRLRNRRVLHDDVELWLRGILDGQWRRYTAVFALLGWDILRKSGELNIWEVFDSFLVLPRRAGWRGGLATLEAEFEGGHIVTSGRRLEAHLGSNK